MRKLPYKKFKQDNYTEKFFNLKCDKILYSLSLWCLVQHYLLNRINEVNTEESKQNVFLIAHSVEREIGDFLHKTTFGAISELPTYTRVQVVVKVHGVAG